jgi:cytochrome c5
VLLATILLFVPVQAGPIEDEIAARIMPVGTVCVEGEDCAGMASAGVVSAGGDNGASAAADNYQKSCSTCHAMGVANAPILGNKDQWESRISKGKDVLYKSAIEGLAPTMPAKGMCFSCSDDDLRAIVDYMIDEAS